MFKAGNKTTIKTDVERVSKLSITIPYKNETIFILKNRDVSAYEILLKIMLSENIKSVLITGYRISGKIVKKLNEQYFKTKYIFSDSIKSMTPSVFNVLKKLDLTLKKIHAKITLIETENNKYIITSSANFGTIDNLDFHTITNNAELFSKIEKHFKNI